MDATQTKYYVRSLNPGTQKWEDDLCRDLAHASEFRAELEAVYANEWGSTEPVTIVMVRE